MLFPSKWQFAVSNVKGNIYFNHTCLDEYAALLWEERKLSIENEVNMLYACR